MPDIFDKNSFNNGNENYFSCGCYDFKIFRDFLRCFLIINAQHA